MAKVNVVHGVDNGFMSKAYSRDRLLWPGQFSELNAQFYRSRPWSYFGQRLTALLHSLRDPALTAAAPDDEPLVIGHIRMHAVGVDEGLAGDRVWDYAAIEATQLLHHASETLFRLYLAHAGQPQCPWLEGCKIRTGQQFWDRFDRLLLSLEGRDARDEIAHRFRGHRSFSSAQRGGFEGSEQEWDAGIDGLIHLLRVVGHRLRDDNPVYNSMKHGLAVVSGHRGVEFRQQVDGEPMAARHGPSVQTLEFDRTTGRWSRWVRWVAVDGTIALASLVIGEIEALMSVGRVLYVGPPEPLGFHFHAVDAIERLRDPSAVESEAPMRVDAFRMDLKYIEPPTK